MTDKEVIIDGVNVTRCEFLDYGIIYSGKKYYCKTLKDEFGDYIDGDEPYCNNNPNCLFKQLQREKQKCKQYRITQKHYNQVIKELQAYIKEDLSPQAQMLNKQLECFQQKVKELQSENEELKDKLRTTGVIELYVTKNEAEQKADRYKQVLKDVKNICEPINCKNPETCSMNQPDYYGEVYGCEPDDWKEPKELTRCPSAVARAVLNKINEVLKND